MQEGVCEAVKAANAVRWQNGDASDCKSDRSEFDSHSDLVMMEVNGMNNAKAQGAKTAGAKETMTQSAIKVARGVMITASHVGGAYEVHNGRSWVLVRPTLEHVNVRFGGYVKTRVHKANAHAKVKTKRK